MIRHKFPDKGAAARGMFTLYLVLLLSMLHFMPLAGQREEVVEGGFVNTRILFVFDGSQSMSGYWESDMKINIARNFLLHVVDSLETLPNVQMGLRVYGHQSPVVLQDCKDTKLEVTFDINNAHKIRQKLRFVKPRGNTPIAYSLDQCAEDFPPCTDCRNIVIMITDGIEECGGDPCEVSRRLQSKGITLKPFIIGIGIDLQCRQRGKFRKCVKGGDNPGAEYHIGPGQPARPGPPAYRNRCQYDLL
jgi:Ca-activated chloride channel family protein